MEATVDLNQVAVFVKVARAQSFTAAASALGLPKSSVSRAVSKLEEQLGVQLLQRTTRRLSLTDAGRAYYERAAASLEGLEEAATAASDMGKDPRGVVRVSVSSDLGVTVLPEVLAEFRQLYPAIHVEVSLSARRVDLVNEGFDLAVRGGILDDSTLVSRKVGASDLGLFASAQYLARRGEPQTLADLAQHDCVLMRARDGKIEWRLFVDDREETVTVRGPVSADDMLMVLRCVESGLGIGLLPSVLLSMCEERAVDFSEADPKRCIRVLPDYAVRGGQLALVWPAGRHVPARVVLFRDFLAKALVSRTAVKWTTARRNATSGFGSSVEASAEVSGARRGARGARRA